MTSIYCWANSSMACRTFFGLTATANNWHCIWQLQHKSNNCHAAATTQYHHQSPSECPLEIGHASGCNRPSIHQDASVPSKATSQHQDAALMSDCKTSLVIFQPQNVFESYTAQNLHTLSVFDANMDRKERHSLLIVSAGDHPPLRPSYKMSRHTCPLL